MYTHPITALESGKWWRSYGWFSLDIKNIPSFRYKQSCAYLKKLSSRIYYGQLDTQNMCSFQKSLELYSLIYKMSIQMISRSVNLSISSYTVYKQHFRRDKLPQNIYVVRKRVKLLFDSWSYCLNFIFVVADIFW